jgi:exoribonuclease-2
MHAFFEEDGTFKAGRVISAGEASFQIELSSGKRSKVKAGNVMFQFDKPEPDALMHAAQGESEAIELDFLYELLPQEEFAALEFAPDYFGGTPTPVQKAALILRLHGAPHYFHRKGKARYRPAPPEILKAARAAIEKKKAQEARAAQMVEELKAGQLPPEIAAAMPYLLFKPDKNGIAFKAFNAACLQMNIAPVRLALQLGALKSPFDLHMQRFLSECFPKGAAHAPLPAPALPQLPVAQVQAFSIDDITTTEIDDAFSVQQHADGTATIGIHIAAPGVAIAPGSAIDAVGRARMSTVYMPGDKITMLPDDVVQAFTLEEGRTMPAVSLYAVVDAQGAVVSTESKIEAVPVAGNLRHNLLDEVVTAQSLEEGSGDYPFANELAVLWRVAKWMSGERDKLRGKPENNNRTDFSFYVDWEPSTSTESEQTHPHPGPPLEGAGESSARAQMHGQPAKIRIEVRKRGAPLDKIVSELMILANSTWAKQLAKAGLPAVFRSQVNGKVRMSTYAAPHEAMGVTHYGWFTSPLRRYSDLVNQRQLLAHIEHGAVAALKAPYKPKDADLFAVISAFEAQYTQYADFQSQMERYWCLRWLAQEGVREADAVVVKDDLVRLTQAPLYIRMAGLPQGARGRPVKIEILKWDEVDLSVETRYLGDAAGAAVAEELDDEEAPHAVDAVQLQAAEAESETGAVDAAPPPTNPGAVDTMPIATDSGAAVS